MIIEIDKNYRVRFDSYNIILEKKAARTYQKAGDNFNKGDKYESWDTIGYYNDITYMVKRLVHDKLLSKGNIKTLMEYLQEYDKHVAKYNKIMISELRKELLIDC
jgi:hypothetical protein